jgi:hypothetical protein
MTGKPSNNDVAVKRVGNDLLDPSCRMPIVSYDGITIRFPAHWPKKIRRSWRERLIPKRR